jgi:hypothetical protein
MTKEEIFQEVATNEWQPEFEFTDDLDAVIDSILKPREDYFLGLHGKVKGIIETAIADYERGDITEGYKISFNNVCNWQKELFEHKMNIIKGHSQILSNINWQAAARSQSTLNKLEISEKAIKLQNQHIKLGLRQSNVKVGEWTPPAPMFLEDLKEMCFPIDLSNFGNVVKYREPKMIDLKSKTELKNREVKICLTDWYKIFETIFYFEDFNYVLGQIVINIMSYVLTGKYLIRK